MAQTRYYSSTAQPTVLTGTVTPSQTNITVQSTVGWPPTVPFLIALDYGTPSEELALVTLQAGLSLTVTRAYDGTSGTAHDVGAPVRHVTGAIDFTESNIHDNSSSAVHGVVGAIVGTTDTQTLTNKTLTAPVINNPSIAGGSTTIAGSVTDTATWAHAGSTHNNGTFNTATIANPSITGTVGGSASYTTPTITSPSITGTVGGSASYTSPTLTGTVTATGATVNNGTYSTPTMRDETVVNSAIGVIPSTINAISGTTADLLKIQLNAADRARFLPDGALRLTPANTATNGFFVNAASGFTGNLVSAQLNAANRFSVTEAGNTTYLGSLTGGSTGQFTVSSTGNIATTGIGQQLWAAKATGTGRANTAARTSDPDLTLSVQANAVYKVNCFLVFDAVTAADISINFTAPASATFTWGALGQPLTASGSTGVIFTSSMNIAGAAAFGGIGTGTGQVVFIEGTLRVAGTSGTFALQWAQAVSDPTATNLQADSHLSLLRVA